MVTYKLQIARLLAVLVLLLPCATVHAGGLTLLDRGSRPMSRGGAFVAGADDPGALWYNPAGLTESGNQILSDFTLTFLFATYQRYQMNPDGRTVFRKEAEVEAEETPLPIPTLAFSHKFGLKNVTFGAGIFAPNTTLLNWPKRIKQSDGTYGPSPTRYSLLGLKGSIYANLAGGLAVQLGPLSLGADVQVSFGRFYAQTALSAYDGVACSFPEQKECDAYTKLDVFPAWGVTGVFGAKLNLGDALRVGVSVMLPYTLRGSAELGIDLPTAAAFKEARLEGNKADFSMNFPLILRAGGEIRPHPLLRMEGAFVWEQWSAQKSIDVKPSEPIYLRNITGITDYQVGDLAIPRNMRDVWSIRGGFEFVIPDSWQLATFKFLHPVIRGGLAFEKGAFDKRDMTPMTMDSDKIVISAGNSFNIHKRVKLDGVIGYMIMTDMIVTNSRIKQPTSIRPKPADVTALGNGNYKMDALYIGGGLTIKLD